MKEVMEKGAQSYLRQVFAAGGTQVSVAGTPVSAGRTPVSAGGTPVSTGRMPVSVVGTPVSMGGMQVARGWDAGGSLSHPAHILEVSFRR